MKQEIGWKECMTLSGAAKRFCWKFDDKELVISRLFGANTYVEKNIKANDLDKVQGYLNEHWGADLGNSVDKLSDDGLGWYLREKLGWKKTADFQLASQIAALFVKSGVWKMVDVNKKTKRGMQFEVKENDWQKCLRDFHDNSPDCTMTN